MLRLLFQDTILGLMCLKKLKLIKLLGNMTMPPLITRLTFINKKALHHILMLSFLSQVVGSCFTDLLWQ